MMQANASALPPPSASKLWMTEDWWSVWLGLGTVLVALVAFWIDRPIRGWAVTPGKWTAVSYIWRDLANNGARYAIIFLFFAVLFAISVRIMGQRVPTFLAGFVVLFAGSLAIFYAAGWKVMQDFNIEAPLLALIVGLAISNLLAIPEWLKASLRTEYYIKTGIVLLGATLPLTLIVSAGPLAFCQASIVSVTTWLAIYWAATRIFKLEPHFGAVLGAGGAICGVSASIAVGGAVQAKKDHISIGIAVVTVWAIAMIFALTIVLKALVPGSLTPGVAGAWVGTTEFSDAAGFAVVAELAARFGDAPIQTFTLTKVIGRDVWIGIWCLILAFVAVMRWEKKTAGANQRVGAGIVWERFPKFVLGFLLASVLISFVAISHRGLKSQTALASYVIDPIKQLRSWAFVLSSLCIGLSTRFKELSAFGMKPFWAFTVGVLVNVPLGFLLSAVFFGSLWSKF